MKLGSLSPGTGHGGGLIGTTKHSNKSKQKRKNKKEMMIGRNNTSDRSAPSRRTSTLKILFIFYLYL
jgi:hypothetical protein